MKTDPYFVMRLRDLVQLAERDLLSGPETVALEYAMRNPRAVIEAVDALRKAKP